MQKKRSNDVPHMFDTNYEFMVKIILYRTVCSVFFPLFKKKITPSEEEMSRILPPNLESGPNVGVSASPRMYDRLVHIYMKC